MKQTENFINLCKGASCKDIRSALVVLRREVRDELAERYGCEDLDTLAENIYLSEGWK